MLKAVLVRVIIAALLVSIVYKLSAKYSTREAHWTGSVWSCPTGYQLVASESEAAQGKDSAHCAR
jgi:hypothetical protein